MLEKISFVMPFVQLDSQHTPQVWSLLEVNRLSRHDGYSRSLMWVNTNPQNLLPHIQANNIKRQYITFPFTEKASNMGLSSGVVTQCMS